MSPLGAVGLPATQSPLHFKCVVCMLRASRLGIGPLGQPSYVLRVAICPDATTTSVGTVSCMFFFLTPESSFSRPGPFFGRVAALFQVEV